MSQTKAQLIDPVDGTIVNADINASAAIAGTKISPDFGSQGITTTGVISMGNGLTLTGTNPFIDIVDSNNNDDFTVKNDNGIFKIQDKTNSVDRLSIDSDGKVGLGTASPDGQLHILTSSAGSVTAASDANDLVLEASANVGLSLLTANDSLARIKFGDPDSASVGAIVYNHADNRMQFNTAGSERMRIDSSGNIGISTTTPRSLLDLGTGTDNSSVSNTAADYQLGLHAAQSTGGDIGRNIAFISQTQGTVCAAINSIDEGASDQTGLVFITGNSSSIAERVRIDQNGYVGINSAGTDSTYMTHIKSSTFGLLKLETTLTGADGAYLELKHTSTSPADNDQLGIIQFKGKNSNDDDNTYGYLMFRSLDVTDGTEDGELQVVTQNAGTAATRLTVGQDGAIKANTGNFVVGTTGRGVQFDTADSGTDQLLDDYEEGTFSFTKRGFASGFDANYALGNQTGKYTKIGRLVTLKGGFNLTGSSGNIAATNYFTVYMNSLPFAMDDTSSGYTGAIVSHQGAWWAYTSLGGGSNAKGAVIAVYNDYLSFYVTSVTGSPSRNSNEITFTITYTSS